MNESAHPCDLVVIIHGMGGRAGRMNPVANVVRQAWKEEGRNEPRIVIPQLDFSMASFDDPCEIAHRLSDRIEKECEQLPGIRNIVLIGYSFGSLIARKAYVYACGDCAIDDLEASRYNVPRSWAQRVERIVLLAGMNRGWHLSAHVAPGRLIQWGLGVLIGNTIMALTMGKKVPLVFRVHRGAPFLTMLRLQWMSICRNRLNRPSPMIIQLLGSIDDIVSPEDNIDLVAGHDFYYLDVPHSGHRNVIEIDQSEVGQARASVIMDALTMDASRLRQSSILPSDHGVPAVDETVTDVVFVIHGIRDEGYWTQKIARRVVALARIREEQGGEPQISDAGQRLAVASCPVKTETSSYGYFAMLPFLLPNVRRKRVEWLMDRYAENRATYPNAEFSYVGHSHGTYMLARALESYPCVRFKNIAFAGSVVRTQYDWDALIRAKRVRGVLNFVASADWVVAIFPRTFQMLGWQDLGSAGHDGFVQAKRNDLAANPVGPASPKPETSRETLREDHYVKGTHGAALKEEHWDVIARFILEGQAPRSCDLLEKRSSFVVGLGRGAPLISFVILAVLMAIGGLLLFLAGQGWEHSRWALAFAVYVALIWKVATWV
ncbi:esterase/lipase family protein [Paraburkholderia sabiae]|uniref:DUF676 domain-containing protein n=1 Tax=Paraburkholderia sabiae TaxID=273251 RepID=A0ABU9QLV1_9BURK|nr:hypothetical protein [Paraburkholderia sabiae]WJZ77332.1 hypothetical protein QEN71_35260 [Paraburkholderia sabiae]CAD6547821.1 hypothetical protein LMG24235_04488 [Paraburkholderia sabiae]